MIRRRRSWPFAVSALVALAFILAGSYAWAQPTTYDRAKWPHWATKDGCDVRFHVLVRDAKVVHREPGEECTLRAGDWRDPYSLQTLHDPKQIDVDHVVPLKWVFEHGGARWDAAKRKAYANDTEYAFHLIAVRADLNRQKGAKGPASWKPPHPHVYCDYGTWWAAIIVRWRLEPGEDDRKAIAELLETCRKRAED